MSIYVTDSLFESFLALIIYCTIVFSGGAKLAYLPPDRRKKYAVPGSPEPAETAYFKFRFFAALTFAFCCASVYLKFASAYSVSSRRKSGCAISIIACARSRSESPESIATPYSVATY